MESDRRAPSCSAPCASHGMGVDSIGALCYGEAHAPAPLIAASARAARLRHSTMRPTMCGRLSALARRPFDRRLRRERRRGTAALAARAPLRSSRQYVEGLARAGARKARASQPNRDGALAVRASRFTGPDGRGAALAAEPGFVKGLVEIQDEGSQLAALLLRRSPAIRYWIFAPVPAARPWRSRRRCRIADRFTPPTTTAVG